MLNSHIHATYPLISLVLDKEGLTLPYLQNFEVDDLIYNISLV